MITRVRRRTYADDRNSVAESWVDLRADIEAINRGEAVRDGNRFTINGRVYVSKGDGGSYPVSVRESISWDAAPSRPSVCTMSLG